MGAPREACLFSRLSDQAEIEAIDVSDEEDEDEPPPPEEGGKGEAAIEEEGKDTADEEPSAVQVGSRIRMCFNRRTLKEALVPKM